MRRTVSVILMIVAGAGMVQADDLTGADRFLCAAVRANVCSTDGLCESGPPWAWNIPQFIEVDLAAQRLRTTAASGENRETSIRHLVREGGLIALQGFEQGRAFSFLITEVTGEVSVAVAREGLTVSVFGSCTPLPVAN